MSYLDELNESQRDAVITTDGPLMVIAGAGSGKTRVITYRIAYLIENICAPKNILAVTFTNKAAKEMKERALKIVGDGASEVTLLTFHSFCHKVLRKYAYLLGLKNSFEILDEDDSKKYIKDALDALNLDSKVYQPKMLKYYFSKIKNNEKIDYILDGDLLDKVKLIYDKYQSLLKADNALDFDDLIYFTVLLFRTQPDILEFYQNLYRYMQLNM
jgi:DNA helicase-2/ATP-dependent DNA helicase PcrA